MHDAVYKNRGSNSRLTSGGLPQNCKPQKLCRAFHEFCSPDLDQTHNIHTADNNSPPLNFWENIWRRVWEIGGRKLGGGALLGLTPYGARTHQLAVASYSAGDPEKKNFFICIESASIWGTYGGLKFAIFQYFVYFCSKLCRLTLDSLNARNRH